MFDTIKGIIGDIAAGAIKDQRIALSREQLSALDLKLRDALHGSDALRAENTRLSQRLVELEQLIADRDAKIQQLTVASQQQKRSADRAEIEQQILLFLAQHAHSIDRSISEHLGVGTEKVLFHLQELERDGLIFGAHFYGGKPSQWSIDQEGRRYLNERNPLP
jgi:hypothetical protein